MSNRTKPNRAKIEVIVQGKKYAVPPASARLLLHVARIRGGCEQPDKRVVWAINESLLVLSRKHRTRLILTETGRRVVSALRARRFAP